MQQQSSISSTSGTVDRTTAATAVQNFYLSWMHHSGNAFTDGFIDSNPYLTSTFKTSLHAGDGSMHAVYCAAQKPYTFSLEAMGTNSQHRNVLVTEKFHTGEMVQLTVGTMKEADGWKVDAVTCGASLSSASSL